MIQTVLYTPTVEISLRDDGIVEMRSLPEMTREFNLDDVTAIATTIKSLGNSLHLLIYISNGKYSIEARKYLASQRGYVDKIAMFANKPLQTLAGNFFLGINRPQIPIRLFNSVEKAEEWLLT